MPIYVYTCEKCHSNQELICSYEDSKKEHLCAFCSGLLKRKDVYSVSASFTGFGFYCKDNPKGGKAPD